MGISAPFARRDRLASVEGTLPRYLGSGAEPGAANAFWKHLGVYGTHFWKAMTPFSTRRVRLASAKGALQLYEGLRRSPSCQRFWEHLGVNVTHFWIAYVNTIFNSFGAHCGLAAWGSILIVLFGNSRRGAAPGQWYWRLSPDTRREGMCLKMLDCICFCCKGALKCYGASKR